MSPADDRVSRETVERMVRRALAEKTYPRDRMTLALAREIAAAVRKRAKEIRVNVVVVIADTAGNPVLLERMDESLLASIDIALGKAYTAAAVKMATIRLKALAQPGGSLYGIQQTNQGKIVIFGGGEPLETAGGIIGGLGVSGGTELEDTSLAAYGASYLKEAVKCL